MLYLPRGPLGRPLALGRATSSAPDGCAAPARRAAARAAATSPLPAPLDELPLLVRAGAILPLLPADVDTLSSYADPSTTSLRERRGRIHLLAFPRGASSSRFDSGGRLRSRERPGRWTLTIRGDRSYRFELEAALGSLEHPFRACEVSVDGRPLAARHWSVDDGVLTARVDGRRVRLVVSGC